MKDKTTTMLLCLFLGGVGAHHYYLGNTGRGIIYTLACLTFIPSIIAFVEFIMLATMSNNDFHMKYNAAYIDHSEDDNHKLDQLNKLYDLKTKGAITEEEFQKKKEKLVA